MKIRYSWIRTKNEETINTCAIERIYLMVFKTHTNVMASIVGKDKDILMESFKTKQEADLYLNEIFEHE